MEEYILCSAIHFDDKVNREGQPSGIESGYVVCGHRHHNCFAIAFALKGDTSCLQNEKEQGFITNTNRFVDRQEARKIAFDAGQLAGRVVQNNHTLYSEDLY